MTDRVILKTVASRVEAELIQSVLAGSGIEAIIISDDCGAVDPALAFGRGVHLTVVRDDLERALRAISSGAQATT